MIGPEYGFAKKCSADHQSPVVLLKTAWGGKDVWCDFRSPSAGDFNWAERQMKAREEREGRSREVGSFFRAMINNVKTGLNQARVHLGREDLELKDSSGSKAGMITASGPWKKQAHPAAAASSNGIPTT